MGRRGRFNTSRAVAVGLLLCGPAFGAVSLEYASRYDRQSETDHLVEVLSLDDGRAVFAGNEGLALVDLAALPMQGTSSYLDRLTGVNARNIYRGAGSYLYVNLNRGETGGSHGFAVVRLVGDTMQYVATRDEPGVLYEKMAFDDDLLYIAAHRHGIRVYDVADPQNPTLVGRIDDGFTDAWAIAIDGSTAFVADGAGGLKQVDVSNPLDPRLGAGETLGDAIGTAEDVAVRDGRVFVAAGGAGVAVYLAGDLGSQTIYPAGAAAKDLAWAGDRLAVATIDGFSIFDVGSGTELLPAARESALRRGPDATLRLTSAIDAAPGDRVLVANWNDVDVYGLVPTAQAVQPDIDVSPQRLRFHKNGGSEELTLSNDGNAPLRVWTVSSDTPSFTVDYTGGTIQPGESVSMTVGYTAGGSGSGRVLIDSDDPDEAIVAIRVYGNTEFLDPGDRAPFFTLPTWTADPETHDLADGSFTLSDHLGRVVWLGIFASW